MQYQFVRKKQTIHPAVPNSGTLVDASVTVYPIRVDQGSPILGECHISYCTTVRGPDILRNVIFPGYVPSGNFCPARARFKIDRIRMGFEFMAGPHFHPTRVRDNIRGVFGTRTEIPQALMRQTLDNI